VDPKEKDGRSQFLAQEFSSQEDVWERKKLVSNKKQKEDQDRPVTSHALECFHHEIFVMLRCLLKQVF
jgi:hypothetical protein